MAARPAWAEWIVDVDFMPIEPVVDDAFPERCAAVSGGGGTGSARFIRVTGRAWIFAVSYLSRCRRDESAAFDLAGADTRT